MKQRRENTAPRRILLGSIALSLANAIAAAFGLSPALHRLTDIVVWPVLTVPIAGIGLCAIILVWINSFMTNRAGQLLYVIHIVLAPFGYQLIGLPYLAGLLIALAPMPLYFGLMALSQHHE